jgi:hypothetical protein
LDAAMSKRLVIVVENDPFPRLLQAFLGREDDAKRTAAIQDFVAHDLPDFRGWLADVRRKAGVLYPADVRLASTQDELRSRLADADAVVTESLEIGEPELAAAPRLRVVHKYGYVLANIDAPACSAHGVRVLGCADARISRPPSMRSPCCLRWRSA